MANIGKKQSADLCRLVENRLRSELNPGANIVVGLSGGVDSVTLTSILARLREPVGFSLKAVHVNHGLSPNAEKWSNFCSLLCDALGVPLSIERADLRPWKPLGIEGAAREARYRLLGKHRADALLLAHHLDDQAETVLVQLLRGAGVAGLAGMPEVAARPARVIRPFLGASRHDIEHFARTAGLSWITDESNSDLSRPRNFLRNKVMPVLDTKFPGVARRLARSSSHLAETSQLLRVLGEIDYQFCARTGALSISRLRELGEVRARNAIRFWSESLGFQAAPTSASVELWRQICDARHDSLMEVRIGEVAYRRYRDCLYLDHPRPSAIAAMNRTWMGEASMVLRELGGTLTFTPAVGSGLSVSKLQSRTLTVRTRIGGERIRPAPGRPSRTLKNVFQHFGIPVWRRQIHPLIFCGDELVSIPSVTVDCAWVADADESSLKISWKEDADLSNSLLKNVEQWKRDPDSASLTRGRRV